ncbi:T1SS secreted agglutinin RTX [Geitlerinema sp. FC II]|nr:T1SS secreted agglutinin RTX [Geitlerinema sp. FC II]
MASTSEGTPVAIDVLSNDTDIDGDTLSVSSVGTPSNGAVAIDADNTLTYTPDANFSGDDSFTYTIDDGNGGTATATVNLTVTPSFDVLVVDTLLDENDGDFSAGDLSFREALDLIGVGGTITFDPNLATQDVGLGLGTIGTGLGAWAIDKPMTINGLGSDLITLSDDVSVNDSNNSTKIEVALDGLTFADGVGNNENLTVTSSKFLGNPLFNGSGGSILTADNIVITGSESAGFINDPGGTATISNSLIANNNGIGVINNGIADLTVINSTISGNGANPGVSGGGGIENFGGNLTVISSTISGNSTTANGGGILNIGSYGLGNLTVTDTVISGNQASGSGAGIYNREGTVNLDNSTISGNAAGESGGGIFNNADLTVNNSTIAANTADSNSDGSGDGGGIFGDLGTAQIANTLIAGNFDTPNNAGGGTIHSDVSGDFTSNGYNLIGDDTGSTGFTNTGDLVGTTTNPIDPLLTPLQDNSGSTFTHALLSGSPAINAGDPNFAPPPDFDQRGTGFPRVVDDRLDIGAFESNLTPPTNNSPITGDDSFSGDEDTDLSGNVLTNDSDPDGDPLTATLLTDVANGSLSFNSDGSFSYTPAANFNGSDSFTYEISDGTFTDTATVNLAINPVNDAPVASDDSISTLENTAVTFEVLSNDSDVDGDSLSVAAVSDAGNGTVDLNADGTLTYTPNTGFSGSDSFTYDLSDGTLTDTATVDVVVDAMVPNDRLEVTADGSTEFYAVDSYGGSQDVTSQLTFAPDGSSVDITGNSWKKLSLDYTITPYTVLKFDFKSTARGEIHGIGFDTDNNISSNRTFKLYGTQNWGLRAFDNYATPDVWQSYEIPVGEFFTGPMNSLTLTNDHDVSNPTANSQFRNLELVEEVPADLPTLTVTTNGTSEAYPLESAYNGQDASPQVTLSPDGSSLQLQGNSWKRINLDYTVTADTILELEFRSTSQGEIHGIGFDNDNRVSSDRLFKFYGTQNWGIGEYENYAAQAGEWKFYQIRVGDFLTGSMPYLIFTNDHDTNNPTASSEFRNIKVYEGTNVQFGSGGNDILTGGSDDDVLIGVDPNQITPGSGEIDELTGDGGADTFVLGDATQAYYDDGDAATAGLDDYASITDFNASEGDVVRLSGTAANYELRPAANGNDIDIYRTVNNESESIGVVEGVSDLDLASPAFEFV